MLNITDKKLTWGISGKQHTRSSITINTKLRTDTINEIHLNIDAKQIQYKTSNVIGFIEGTHEPDSFLVLTAHYDHLGMMGNKTIFPGANDNASGVAMLLNLAKFYGANPHRYSMVFMALSAEELGLIGAKYFVDNPYFNLGKIKFLINFDLAGTGDEGIKVVNGGVYKKHFNKLQSLNSQGDYLPAIKPRGEACNSDHCLFYQQGVPCFYIYTLGGIQAYHDIYDKAETLPLTEFENYCQLMIDFVNSF